MEKNDRPRWFEYKPPIGRGRPFFLVFFNSILSLRSCRSQFALSEVRLRGLFSTLFDYSRSKGMRAMMRACSQSTVYQGSI